MAQTVKNPPAVTETWVRFLSQEDPLEKGMATHSSILAWKIPWTEEPGWLQCMGSQRDTPDPLTLWDLSTVFSHSFFLTSPLPLRLSIWAFFFSHFLESENSTSLNTSSTGKLVMTSNFANAMPWCMDTMLPTTVISGSAEGPNETGQKSLSRAWCLVLYSLAVALLNYIETYESLNCSLNVLVWLHPSFLPTG